MSLADTSVRKPCGFTRRDAMCAMAGTAIGGSILFRPGLAGGPSETTKKRPEWPVVRAAHIRPKGEYWMGWPGKAWDIEGYTKKSRALIEEFGNELKVRVEFEPEPLYDAEAAEAFSKKCQAEKPDGVVLFPMHLSHWGWVQKAHAPDLPTVIIAPLGTTFTQQMQPLAKLPKVYLASTSDYELPALKFGLKMIRTAHDMRQSKIAVIRGTETKEQTLEPLGLTLRYMPRARFPEVLATVETTSDVVQLADELRETARGIVEPSDDDLLNSAKNYFASRKLMKEEGCDGITMDCLGLLTAHKMPCPPCVAWSRLLDQGVPAICEADTNAVMSHTLCCMLLGKPGFQQDPVPETVHNTLIGAHCTCPTRLDGYDQPPSPFVLRSHSESDIGVSVQVLWKPGQDVTVMQFAGPGKMLLGRGKVLTNHETPPAGGCRTSVEIALDAPADTRDTKGFHQLFVYGDHVRDFAAYGQMYGIATESI